MGFRSVFLVLALSAVLLPACQKDEPRQGGVPAGEVRLNADAEIKVLQDILKTDPKNLNALIKLGNISMDTQRYAEAIDAYGRALEIDPNNVNVRVDRGTCYRNIGQPEKAIGEYRKGLAVEPRHAFGNKNLAIVLAYDLRKLDEAEKALENYMKLNPADPDAALIKADIQKLKTGK